MDIKRKFGLISSPKDDRDFKYSEVRSSLMRQTLPQAYVTVCTPVRDQGEAGTCVGMASAACQESDAMLNGTTEHLSPLFVYRECKRIDGINQEGTYLRTAMKVLQDKGICLETLYPYSDNQNIQNLKFPTISTSTYNDGKKRKIKNYASLTTVDEIKTAIYNENAVLLGTYVTDSFMYPQGGCIGKPSGRMYGGHAIAAVGWDDNIALTFDYKKVFGNEDTGKVVKYKGAIKIKNSWSEEWGIDGYAWIPYELFDIQINQPFYFNLVSEAWTTVGELDVDANTDFHKDANKEPEKPKTITMTLGSKVANVFGQDVLLSVAPTTISNSTVIPLRFLGEALGYTVNYFSLNKKITVNNLVMYIGKTDCFIGSQKVTMPVAPTIIDNTTMVPLRFICEKLGCTVGFDGTTKTITIYP